MISVICVWNDEKQYNEILLSSLKKQNCKYELVGIDNRKNIFKSAACALNFGGKHSRGDILIFVHQDVAFAKADSLLKFCEYIKNHSNYIVGAYGEKKHKTGEVWDTVDECCFGMSNETFIKLSFNENICTGWHLYAVELCLHGKDVGIRSKLYNPSIKHLSGGNVNDDYMRTFKKLILTYKHQKYIWTTCKKMPCSLFYYYLYYFIWKIKKQLIGNYPLVNNFRKFFKYKI